MPLRLRFWKIEILCIFNAILGPLPTKTPTVLHISQLRIHTRCILGNGSILDGHDSFPVIEYPFDNCRRCWDNMVLLDQALASTPPARQANKDFPIEASRYLAASDFPASPSPSRRSPAAGATSSRADAIRDGDERVRFLSGGLRRRVIPTLRHESEACRPAGNIDRKPE